MDIDSLEDEHCTDLSERSIYLINKFKENSTSSSSVLNNSLKKTLISK